MIQGGQAFLTPWDLGSSDNFDVSLVYIQGRQTECEDRANSG